MHEQKTAAFEQLKQAASKREIRSLKQVSKRPSAQATKGRSKTRALEQSKHATSKQAISIHEASKTGFETSIGATDHSGVQ